MDPNLVITQFCDDYHSREDVIKALKTTVHQYIGKKRILLYLVASNQIKPTSDDRYFMNQLNTLKVRYTADVQTYLSDHFEPLEAIPDVSRRNVITGDIPRFKSRFYELMGHLNCSHIVSLIEQNSDSFDLSLHRIFALLSQRSNINYIQGHDRLCMGIMALAFHFYGIPKNLSTYMVSNQTDEDSLRTSQKIINEWFRDVEAISYYLVEKLILLANCKYYINTPENNPLFLLIDQYIEQKYPEEHELMSRTHQGPFIFALQWRILFFADTVENFYPIWDHVFACDSPKEVENLLYFISCAVIDSFKSIHKNDNDGRNQFYPSLNGYHDWNVTDILNSTQIIINETSCQQATPKINFFLGFCILFLFVICHVAFIKYI